MEASWIAIWVNALLVIVTAVYAGLTWRLAKSSKEAALASADSARTQRAAVEAEANRRHAWFKTAGGGPSSHEYEIVIRPLLGAYFLRKVVLQELTLEPLSAEEGETDRSSQLEVNHQLFPKDGEGTLFVDEAEGAWFTVDFVALIGDACPENQWRVKGWSCMVTFSLSEFSESNRRVAVYSDPADDPRIRWLREARELGLS